MRELNGLEELSRESQAVEKFQTKISNILHVLDI